jgi:hypothetical protein
MKDTISEHNDQETLASKGVTDTVRVLIEEASSALSCGDSNIVQTYREDILQSLKILVDPHQHNNKRTLAIHIASVRNHIGNIRIALHEYETAYSFYETAYRMHRKVFGPINLNTSITAFNAGKCLHCLGRPDRALRYNNFFTKEICSSIKAKLMTQETGPHPTKYSMGFPPRPFIETCEHILSTGAPTTGIIIWAGSSSLLVILRVLHLHVV